MQKPLCVCECLCMCVTPCISWNIVKETDNKRYTNVFQIQWDIHVDYESYWIFLCFIDRASLSNLVNKTNLVSATLHTRQSSTQNNKYQVPQKHSFFSWWWAHSHLKHVGIDKYSKNKLCTKLVLFTSLLDHSKVLIANLLTIFHTSFAAKFMTVLLTEFCILTFSGWLSSEGGKCIIIYALLLDILKGKITETKLHIFWRWQQTQFQSPVTVDWCCFGVTDLHSACRQFGAWLGHHLCTVLILFVVFHQSL
jgi:hypothetical protein